MKTFIIFSILAIAAMASDDVGDDTQLENLLRAGNNKFTARMAAQVAKKNAGKNYVLSAFSVLTPLAQLSLASVDESHDELLDTIGMPNDNTTKEVFSVVNTRVKSLKGITLKTASKIYIADKYELNCQFAEDTRSVFGSEIESMNFLESQKAAKEVNTWVEEQTNNRIKDLVDPSSLTADTRALLVNAIYFKGLWKEPFDKQFTQDYTFHVNNEATAQVRMMFKKKYYKYVDSLELKSQIIEIPYEGDESSLVIVLPKEIEGINEVQQIFENPDALENALKDAYFTEVEFYVPQFKIETTTNLLEILQDINVRRIFDPKTAKLDKLIEGVNNLYIDNAKQKAFIEMNEEGTEAAAANVFGIAFTSSIVYKPPPTKFICDHPFLFFLRGRQYTLFNGAFYAS